GPCSQQVISTGNAWYAVGVGSPYQATVDADFSSNSTGNCYAPYDIYFYDYSSNATSVIWDFGDGNTSTANNPVHTYTAPGDYTVSFNVNSSCGSDSTVAIDYIKIGPEAPCEVILPGTGQASSQNSCTGSIYDNGGPNANYTNDANSYVVINPTGAGSVTLTISDFDIEAGSGGSNCDYDYLEFFDGIGVGAPSLGRYCNNNLPPTTISSTSSAITVRFLSDGGVTNAGFKVDWECNEPTSAPEADFEANTTETCDGEVHFTDLSMNGAQEWLWDFGDGTSDTVQNPTHTYSSSGNYTVKLTASNGIGSDVITKQNYIIVSRPEAPIGENQEICPGETATLSASSDGEHRWFSDPFGTSPIYEGDHFTTPVIQTSTPYYVESIMAGASQSAGASGNGIGSGGFLNFNQSLYFDVFAPFILHSVKVYAATAGPRQIVVLNSSGVVIASKTVQIPFGQQTVELDFELGPGTDYQLGLSATSEINLYRNDSGTDYPYDLAGVLSITRSSAGTGPLDYYYYFYDWQVKEFCISERAEIIASTSICAGVEEVNKSGFDVFPNPAKNLITVKSINQSEGFSINIYDMRGQLVKSSAVESSDQSEVNVGELSRGVYLLRIKQNNRVQQTERIVLQ
ncbi:MAG: PKD domain-containing protein, partial [Salibacteraceae bacterium]